MWSYRLTAPASLERIEAPPPSAEGLGDGQLLVRFLAGGICGSDVPKFRAERGLPPLIEPGWPFHEVVGLVIASRAAGIAAGQRVVGHAEGARGLAELSVNAATSFVVVDPALGDVDAVVVQPLGTVMSALARVPRIAGARVAVIGQGALGSLFAHALKDRGAAHVTTVDLIDRSAHAGAFGVDAAVRASSEDWAKGLRDADRPRIVVEAVGHQTTTLADAVEAVAVSGHVVGFGVPDDPRYPFPYERFFRKDLTLTAGVTQDWVRHLDEAQRYLLRHPGLARAVTSHVLPVTEAQRAFQVAAGPAADRLKVVLSA